MEKKQFFGMYIGQKVETPDGVVMMRTLQNTGIHGGSEDRASRFYSYDDCTLILRPVTSLTDDEKVAWYDVVCPESIRCEQDKIYTINGAFIGATEYTPAEFTYLLSIGIDLFDGVSKGYCKYVNE